MLVETVLYLFFYRKLIEKSDFLIFVISCVLVIFLLFELYFKNLVDDFFSFTLTIKSLSFIVLSLYYFYQVYTKEKDIFKNEAPQFWYNVGILIYFSLAFFPFLLATEMMSGLFDYSLWFVHNIGNFSKNIIFAVGLWMVQKR